MTDNYQTNEDVAKLFRETLNRDGIESLSSQVTDNLNKWKSVYIKVAVTGNSGAGKSSLINALIDSHEHLDFELGKLQVKIAMDAPGIVKTSLILTFKNTSKEVIEAKVKELKNRARWVAIKAVVSGAPGAHYLMDGEVIENEISFYKKELGLDDGSLGKACKALEVDMENLKKTILSVNLALSPDKMFQYWCNSKETLNSKSLVLKSLFDGIESVLQGFLCKYTKVYSSLCNILDILKKNSIEIIENIVDKNHGSSSV